MKEQAHYPIGTIYRKGKRTRKIVSAQPMGSTERCLQWVAFQTPTDIRQNTITQERPEIFAKWVSGATIDSAPQA